MKYSWLLILVFLAGCNGSDGGDASAPVYVGTYHSDCNIVSGDSWRGQLTITATTLHNTGFYYTGNTTCAGTGVEGIFPPPAQYTIGQSSADVFELVFDSGATMVKMTSSGIVMDLSPLAPFDPDWDYLTEGSYQEFFRD